MDVALVALRARSDGLRPGKAFGCPPTVLDAEQIGLELRARRLA